MSCRSIQDNQFSKDVLDKSLITGKIFDVKRYAIHDGPGIRTTVFIKGCPLNCFWCHNPEGISKDNEFIYWSNRCIQCGDCIEICPEHAIRGLPNAILTDTDKCTICGTCINVCTTGAREIVGEILSVNELINIIKKDRIHFDQSQGGVTFSGGEPLSQIEFLDAALECLKDISLNTVVDTSGYAPTDFLLKIEDKVDLFLFDLKIMDDSRHKELTGVSNRLIHYNLQMLSDTKKKVIIRIPIIPGVNDDRENIINTGMFVSSLENINQIDILPYHNTASSKYQRLNKEPRFENLRTPTDENMEEIKTCLEHYGIEVRIGG